MSEHLSVSAADKTMEKEISRIDEILKFCAKYDLCFIDAKVKDLRHIVPLMLMEAYSNIYGLYSRKVKGIWEKKPDDWPDLIPFVDPNNKLKQSNGGKSGDSNSKPTKQVCLDMLNYLHGLLLKQEKVCLSLAAQQKASTTQASTMSDIKPANVPDHRVQVPLPSPLSDFSRPSSVLSTDVYISRVAEPYPSRAAGTVKHEAGEDDDETVRAVKSLEPFNLVDYITDGTFDIDSLCDMASLGIASPTGRDDLSTTVDLAAIRTNCGQHHQGQSFENLDQARQVLLQPGEPLQSNDETPCNSLQEPSYYEDVRNPCNSAQLNLLQEQHEFFQISSADGYMQWCTLDPVLNATAADNDVPYQIGASSPTTGFDSTIQTNSYVTANQSLPNQSHMLQSINNSAINDQAFCSKLQKGQTSNSFMTAIQPTQMQTYQSINNTIKLDLGFPSQIQTLATTSAFDVDGANHDSFITCDQEKAPMQIDTCSAADDEVLPQTVVDYSAIFDMMGKLKTLTNLSNSQVSALCPEDKKQLIRLFEMFVDFGPTVEVRLKQIQHLMGNSVAQGTVCSHSCDFSMEYSQNVDYTKPIQLSGRQNSTADATSILPVNDITTSKCNISNNCGKAIPMQTNKVIATTSVGQMQVCKTLEQDKSIIGQEKLIVGQHIDSGDLNIKHRGNANVVYHSIERPFKPSLDLNESEPEFNRKVFEEEPNSQMKPAKSDMKYAEMTAKHEESVVALKEDDLHVKASGIGSGDSQIALRSLGSGVDSNYFSGESDSSMSPTSGSFPSLSSNPSIDLRANRDIILHDVDHAASFGQDDFSKPSIYQVQPSSLAQADQYGSDMYLSGSSGFASSYVSRSSAGNLINTMSQTERLLTGSASVSAMDDRNWPPGLEANRVVGQSLASQQNTSAPSVIAINSNVTSGNNVMLANLGVQLHTPSGYVSDVSASGSAARSSSSRVEYCGNKGINANPNMQSHAIVSFSKSNHMIGGSAGTIFHFAGSNSQSGMMSTTSTQSFITPASSMSGNFLMKQPQQFLLPSNNVIAGGKGRVLPPTSLALGVSEPKVPTPVNEVASSTLIPGFRGCKVGDKRRYMDVQENEQKEAVNTHNTVVTFGPIPMCVENFDFEDYDVQPSKRHRN